MLKYMELYRKDVLVLSIISYFIGILLAGGIISYTDIIISLLISFVSINFGYSINSYEDWEIDKINKPHRPIPSGKIKPENALLYSLVLLVLSVIYPLFFFDSYITLSLFMLFPILGIAYSLEPLRLKKYGIVAVLLTAFGLNVPLILGFVIHSGAGMLDFFASIFLFSVGVIILKNISDVKGDKQYKIKNIV